MIKIFLMIKNCMTQFMIKIINCVIQFNYKNQSSFSSPLFVSLLDLGKLSYISLSPRKSRPFIFACESRWCIGYPDSESPSPCTIFFFFFFFFIPLPLFWQANPVRLTRWNFSTLFSRPCARYQIPSFPPSSPRFCAVFHVHTRTFVFLLAVR